MVSWSWEKNLCFLKSNLFLPEKHQKQYVWGKTSALGPLANLLNQRRDCAIYVHIKSHFDATEASLCRNTPLTYSSVKAGKTKGFASKARWRCWPWITCWPATSGPPTRSSSTGKSPLRTTWPRPTSCCGWKTTGRSSTPWGGLSGCRPAAAPVAAFRPQTCSEACRYSDNKEKTQFCKCSDSIE